MLLNKRKKRNRLKFNLRFSRAKRSLNNWTLELKCIPGRVWGWAKGSAATPLPLTFRIILVEFHLRKKKVSRIEPLSVPAAPAEMHPTIVSGIDTVDVLVSCWPILIFPLSLVTIPEVLKKIP